MATDPQRILVVKLGALGDFIQALGPAQAIRRAHPGARITLLTTPPYAALAEASGYFDEVWVDSRPRLWQPRAWLELGRRLRAGDFQRVYDLQTSDRSGHYFRLMGRQPEWSGIAPGCSHPHANPRRDRMHTVDRQAEQLALAGIDEVPPADLSWLGDDGRGAARRFGLKPPYVLLVPGGAAHRPAKRWPAAHYAALAGLLAARGLALGVLGDAKEAALTGEIASHARFGDLRNLAGQTSLADVASLARGARAAVGNDTGPMHLIAATGCHAVVLFSGASDPALCAPRGRRVTILRREPLAALPVEEVLAALEPRPARRRARAV